MLKEAYQKNKQQEQATLRESARKYLEQNFVALEELDSDTQQLQAVSQLDEAIQKHKDTVPVLAGIMTVAKNSLQEAVKAKNSELVKQRTSELVTICAVVGESVLAKNTSGSDNKLAVTTLKEVYGISKETTAFLSKSPISEELLELKKVMMGTEFGKIKHPVNLREVAERRALTEGILDYFRSDKKNIQTFQTKLAELQKISTDHGMKNLQRAVATAARKFEDTAIAQETGEGKEAAEAKSSIITKVTSFTTIISNFLRRFKEFTVALPTIKSFVDSKNPAQLKTALTGEQLNTFTRMIQKQFQNVEPGWLSKLFRVGVGEDTLTFFGYDDEQAASDLLELTGEQLASLAQRGSVIVPPAPLKPAEVQQAPVTQPPEAPTSASIPSPKTAEDVMKSFTAMMQSLDPAEKEKLKKLIGVSKAKPTGATPTPAAAKPAAAPAPATA